MDFSDHHKLYQKDKTQVQNLLGVQAGANAGKTSFYNHIVNNVQNNLEETKAKYQTSSQKPKPSKYDVLSEDLNVLISQLTDVHKKEIENILKENHLSHPDYENKSCIVSK